MAGWARQQPGAVTASPAGAGGVQAASANNVRYGGGNDGIRVTTGDERVYLVFFGSQWGTQGANGKGDVTLSGDPSGEAPYLQDMFKGLGTGNEQWSGVMTQYCEGVGAGAQSCPATAPHVAYPHGGALAAEGVWVDESAPSPEQATGHQLAQEAVDAAAHFGNTTAASTGTPPTSSSPRPAPTPMGSTPRAARISARGTTGTATPPSAAVPSPPPTVTSRSPTCPTSPTPASTAG
jgi:hypothetical protein